MLTLLALASLALSQEPEPELALKGLDPVALCEGAELEGEPDLVADFGRYRYRFVSEESRAIFRADPRRWGIQWGGGCGRMGPLSGRGAPNRWAVLDERIFIFASDGCREGFLMEPDLFLPLAPARRKGDREAGREWIERAVGAHLGVRGLLLLDRGGAVRLTSSSTSSDWTNELELLLASDGSLRRRSVWTPPSPDQRGFDTVWVSNPNRAFTIEGGTLFDLLSDDERADLRRFAHREVLPLLWGRRRPEYLAFYVGETENGHEVDVSFDGLTTTLFLEDDGTIRGLAWTGRLNDGVTTEIRETFTEWTTTDDGLQLPIARTVSRVGMESTEGPWKVEFLGAAPKNAFRKP